MDSLVFLLIKWIVSYYFTISGQKIFIQLQKNLKMIEFALVLQLLFLTIKDKNQIWKF